MFHANFEFSLNFAYLDRLFYFFESQKRRKYVRQVVATFSLFVFMQAVGFASELEAFSFANKQGEKILFLSSDVVKAIELAKLEAQQLSIDLARLPRYMVVLAKGTIRVSISPPYKGGFDGPEFTVEIRRSDFKVLNVLNKLDHN